MNLAIWHAWVIVGILFFIGEIFTPGFFLACLGIACLGSGLASAFGLGIGSQILVFSITTLAVFFGIRPFFLKYLYSPGTKVETNVKALVGKTGLVSERIDSSRNKGRVVVGGEDWRAVSIDETVIESGEKIAVVQVEGTKLVVKSAPIRKEG